MKESLMKKNNAAHLHGFLNDVRMYPMENGRTAINLDVVTIESYKKDKNSDYTQKRTYHDVSTFTDDPKVVEMYEKIREDFVKNDENRDVEGYKAITHTISLDGTLVNRDNKVKNEEGKEYTYDTVQIISKPENIKLDVPQEEKEIRNVVVLSGNVAAINHVEDKKFAAITLINHFYPKGEKKGPEDGYSTRVTLLVSEKNPYSKETYAKIANGELGVGDFIRIGGRLHNNTYQRDNEVGKRYGMNIDVSDDFFQMLKKRGEKVEKTEKTAVEEKVEVAEKPAEKKKAKKAVSRKKGIGIG